MTLMVNHLVGFGAAPSAASSSDADVNAYIAAMSSTPDATRTGHIETLITGLKSDGIWSKLSWLTLFAAHDAQAARINAKTPSQVASAVNSPTFTTDLGYTGDGSTAYLDTGALGSSLSDTDNCMFAFVRTGATNAGSSVMGSDSNLFVLHNTLATNLSYRGLTGSSSNLTRGGIANQQLAGGRRIGTTQNAFRGDTGGVTQSTTTTVSTSATAGNIRFLGRNAAFSNGQLSAGGFGQYLSDTECTNLNTHLRTYLTAVGAL